MSRLVQVLTGWPRGSFLTCLVSCCFFPVQEGTAQEPKTKAVEAVYDFYLDLGLSRKYQASLFIEGARSLFIWGPPLGMRDEKQPNEFHLTLGGRDSLGSYTFTDRQEDRMYSRIPFHGGKSYQVCEPMPSIPWSFNGPSRQIGPYRCERATGTFRGREYEVWFAPEVPVSVGPWKLHGLPGLVVLARDRSGEIVFRLNTLKPGGRNPPAVAYREDCLDTLAYARLQEEWASALLKRMNAKLPRGSRLSLGSRNTMEHFE